MWTEQARTYKIISSFATTLTVTPTWKRTNIMQQSHLQTANSNSDQYKIISRYRTPQFITNTVFAVEPKCSTPLIPKTTTGQNHEPIPFISLCVTSYLRSILKLSIFLDISSSYSPITFPIKILYEFFASTILALCPGHCSFQNFWWPDSIIPFQYFHAKSKILDHILSHFNTVLSFFLQSILRSLFPCGNLTKLLHTLS